MFYSDSKQRIQVWCLTFLIEEVIIFMMLINTGDLLLEIENFGSDK